MDKADSTWKNYARELGINTARARTANGYSQDRVAADAGLSRSTYWKLERRESNPDPPPTLESLPSPRRSKSN
ncbi:XRE family transcriptional regulator [Bifidobacterium asteroides]|nr:XRE family transcriptional regulator [Bifidobacterium asteroides]